MTVWSRDTLEMEDADNEVGSAGLEALHQLRKLANHPVLVRHIFTKAILPELAADLIRVRRKLAKRLVLFHLF
jgi:hypothetical protein